MEKHVMEFGSADQLCGFQSTQLVILLLLNKIFEIQTQPTPKTNWCFNQMIKNNYHRANAIG